MNTFPKCIKRVQGEPTLQERTGEPQLFSITHSGGALQAAVLSAEKGLFFIVQQQLYMLEGAALLLPEYSSQGVLLSIGLECGSDKLVIRDSNATTLKQLLTRLNQKLSVKGFNEYYRPLKRLGRGNFATVYLVEHKFSKQVFAAKVFGRCQQYLEIDGKAALENEISIMRELSHCNIMKIEAVHETENLVYLIVEYMEGGTLEDYMRSRLHLTGQEICKIISQMLEALDYLSSKGIMHRDIKPSNIMQRRDTGDWVLTDFGLAARINTDYLYQKCGTPGFIALEILRLTKPEEKYTHTCDVFSLGVIIYTLVIGKMPFQCQDQQDMYETNKKCEINLPEREKQELNPDILQFLMGLLDADPKNRLTPRQALQSKLLKNAEVSSSLAQYFESQRDRAMKKVLQFANHANYQ